jgi:hypothetical protein
MSIKNTTEKMYRFQKAFVRKDFFEKIVKRHVSKKKK